MSCSCVVCLLHVPVHTSDVADSLDSGGGNEIALLHVGAFVVPVGPTLLLVENRMQLREEVQCRR